MRSGTDTRARCIHIVESLDRGAVENWLVRMLRHARLTNSPVDWTFYCTIDEPGGLESAATELKARVLKSPVPLIRTLDFMRALRNEIRSGGYTVMHAHHDLLNAVYLTASIGTGVRRIAHVHNADEALPTDSQFKKLIYREPMRQVCISLAHRVIGISQHTLDTFLAGRPRRPKRDEVHYYGVDPAPYREKPESGESFRSANAIPSDADLMLFAGRMVPEKNPVFAVDVLAELSRLRPNVIGVFAGHGSEHAAVRARVSERGIESLVRFIGWRHDLPAVMAECDLFVLPRPDVPLEGFGLAVVEAQLAGLKLLVSTGVADDPLLPSAAVRRLTLAEGSARWAQAAADLLDAPPVNRDAVLADLARSPMNMDFALRDLLRLHAE